MGLGGTDTMELHNIKSFFISLINVNTVCDGNKIVILELIFNEKYNFHTITNEGLKLRFK